MKIVINGCYGGFQLSHQAIDLLKSKLGNKELNFFELSRHDKNLVEVIEELGSNTNTNFSEIKIVEIPDGLDYMIDEYDGLESVVPFVGVTKQELKQGLSEEKLNLLNFTDLIKLV